MHDPDTTTRTRDAVCTSMPARRHPLAWLLWPYLASIALVAALAWSDSLPIAVVEPWDKLIHLLGIGGLTALLDLWLRGRNVGPLPFALVLVAGLAVADELAQAFAPYRSFDGLDLTANVLGPIMCVALARRLIRAPRGNSPNGHSAAGTLRRAYPVVSPGAAGGLDAPKSMVPVGGGADAALVRERVRG